MDKINRTLYLLLIGIAEVFFFAYTMVLYKRGTIDSHEFQMGCIYMAMMALMGLSLVFSNTSLFRKKQESGGGTNLFEMSRTREGTIFEVLTLLILVGAWTVALASHRFWIIDGFFSYIGAVILFMLTIVTITFLWLVYVPNYMSQMKKYTHVKPIILEVRMIRVLALELALIALFYNIPIESGSLVVILLYVFVVVFLATVAIFRYLIYKAK